MTQHLPPFGTSVLQDSTSTAGEPDESCPECSGEVVWAFAIVTGIDTAYKTCLDCGWQGEPE